MTPMDSSNLQRNLGVLLSHVAPIAEPPEVFEMTRDHDGPPKTNFPQRVIYHSYGFEWGYMGSGPADLALNILALCTNGKTAVKLHQQFKEAFIATLPYEGGSITASRVREWIATMLQDEEEI